MASRRASLRLWSWVAAWLAVSGGAAHAQPLRAPHADVFYEAPVGCPERALFEEQLARRAPQPDGAPRARIRVRIQQLGAGAAGDLVFERGAQPAQRHIEAASCAEVVEALALIAALLLDPVQAAQPPATGAHRRAPTGTAPVHPASDAAASSAVRSRAAPEPAASSDEPVHVGSAPAAPASEPAPAPSATAPGATGRLDQEPDASAPPKVRRLRGALLASALLVSGIAPRVRPALALGALSRARLGVLELDLRLAARSALRYRAQDGDGTLTLRWWSAAGSACLGGRLGPDLTLSGCAAAEAGQLRARGSHTRAPRHVTRAWGALGPGLSAAWQLAPRWSLHASAEALLPLRRDSYQLADTSVFSVPRLTIRAELAAGFWIW